MLAPILAPWEALERAVVSKALLRLRFDGLEACPELTTPGSPWCVGPRPTPTPHPHPHPTPYTRP